MAELFEEAVAFKLVGALLVSDQLAHYAFRKHGFSIFKTKMKIRLTGVTSWKTLGSGGSNT